MSLVTDTLNKLNTVVAGVSGITAVYQGYKRFSDSQNFQDIVSALSAGQGIFEFHLTDARRGIQGQDAIFNVAAWLYTPVPKDTSNLLTTDINLAELVLDTIMVPATWVGQTPVVAIPNFGSYKFLGVSVTKSGGIATFAFGGPDGGELSFMGGC